jgi:2-amino-4-hydroxy-6-hydroxymethyldihydropteridine diphosphokinase
MITIGCGSNLKGKYADSDAVLHAAYAALDARGIKIIKKSSIWITRPVPASDQPWFRNSVIVVQTSLRPHALLDSLKAIEADFGRQHNAPRNAARVLDLDILTYNDDVIGDGDLVVPHPRMNKRPFVMLPFWEVNTSV